MVHLYARWLDAWGAPTQPERRATCGDCPMCEVPGLPPPATAYAFRPDVKCCASMPVLPSFLVGGILRGPDGPGLRSVRDRIAARAAVGPLGLGRPAQWRLVADHAVNVQGRSTSLRCPHFVVEDGTCGIHAHRNHACATWFCKHERGGVGQAWWAAAGDLLRTLEGELSRWAALELGLSATELARAVRGGTSVEDVDADAVDGRVSDAAWAGRWGPWAGREEAFYVAASERVEALSPSEALALGGATARVQAAALQVVTAAMGSGEVPASLRPGSLQTLAMGPQGWLVAGYSGLDPIVLPSLLLEVLHAFDGRPTTEVLAVLADERGLQLEPSLLRQLVDFGVLR